MATLTIFLRWHLRSSHIVLQLLLAQTGNTIKPVHLALQIILPRPTSPFTFFFTLSCRAWLPHAKADTYPEPVAAFVVAAWLSLLSFIVDLFVFLVVVGLVALVVRLRNFGGVRFNLVLLLIVGFLVLTVLSLAKLIATMLGVILLLSISFGLLLTLRMRQWSHD